MFGRLRDQLKTALGTGEPRWKELVETFEFKYPTVRVATGRLHPNTVPQTFLVWRTTSRHEEGAGVYTVDLYRSKEALMDMAASAAMVSQPAKLLQSEFAREMTGLGWRRRTEKTALACDSEPSHFFLGQILNWGLFGYESEHGVGEFCHDGHGRSFAFPETFVLDEERHLIRRGRA